MSHLTPAEMIDLFEGTLPDARRAHASQCARCRDEAAQAAIAFEAVRDADVPEPSPFYWDHLARHLHDAIREERPRARWRGLVEWRGAVAAAAAVMLIVIGSTLSWRAGVDVSGPAKPAAPAVALTEQAAPQSVSLESDPEWDVVSGVANGMEWDAAGEAGFSVKPGAAEHAVLQLTDEQREELGRMLQAEIARIKS
jgi:predicted anti-sigma-YlaC factor YlaD